jgi:hypothetical protein
VQACPSHEGFASDPEAAMSVAPISDVASTSADRARPVVIVSPGGRARQGDIETVTSVIADGLRRLIPEMSVHIVDSRERGTAWTW